LQVALERRPVPLSDEEVAAAAAAATAAAVSQPPADARVIDPIKH
jgi:hypothetical protein